MVIAIALYEDFTALDAFGPNEVLAPLPGAEVRWLARAAGPVTSDSGGVQVVADGAWEDVPAPDVLVVPGGTGTQRVLDDERLIAWIRRAHETSAWTTSVCTGSLLLAAAGLLDGVDAATHWMRRDQLTSLGARAVPDRVVERGKVITAAGVSSGIDMALTLAARLAGDDVARAVQLAIEYDPEPPFDSGTREKAPSTSSISSAPPACETPRGPARQRRRRLGRGSCLQPRGAPLETSLAPPATPRA